MGQRKTAADATTLRTATNHLLEFEKISFDDRASKTEATDEELNSRYAKGEIRIVTEQARYPLAGILEMLKAEVDGDNGGKEPRYKLDPEYQRRHRWNDKRKSRLIESFLMNVPVPPIFLYERDLARFEVMDGRQRLTALKEFYGNEFKLVGLQYWSDLDGKFYKDLPVKIRDGIDRRYISSIILLKETARDEEQAAFLKKIVFERLNSGGVELTSQETRNAVYDGPLNKLCLELSTNEKFRFMWDIPSKPPLEEKNVDEENSNTRKQPKAGERIFKEMQDVELVLRFFAYRRIDAFPAGLNKVTEFLDRFIFAGNKFSTENLKTYRSMFEKTVSFLWDILEKKAFTVLGSSRKQPSKIVYDPLMFVANSPDVVPHHTRLIKNKPVLIKELEKMYSGNSGLFAGRRTNKADTQNRNRCMSEAFAAAIAKIN